MGIRISKKTSVPNTLKLLGKLSSFRFEQQYDEMKKWDNQSKDYLNKLIEKLSKIV